MNNIILNGTLVSEPKVLYTTKGLAYTVLRVVNTLFRDKRIFININIFGELAKKSIDNLQKGDKIVVNGFLTQRSYVGKNNKVETVIEIEAEDIQMTTGLSKKTNTITTMLEKGETPTNEIGEIFDKLVEVQDTKEVGMDTTPNDIDLINENSIEMDTTPKPEDLQ